MASLGWAALADLRGGLVVTLDDPWHALGRRAAIVTDASLGVESIQHSGTSFHC